MFSVSRARSSMIFEARNSSRRFTIVTREENLARKSASSIAESPPPTITRRLVLVERGVAGRAVGHAAAAELLLAGHAELLVLGAHREDDRAGLVLLVVDPHRVRLAVGARLDLGDVVGDEARAEALRLVAELLHHLRPHDPLGVAGVVLDVGRLLEQPAPEEALDHERVQVRAGGVERRGVARRTASDDDDLLDVRHVLGLLPGQSLPYFSLYSVARAGPPGASAPRSCAAADRRSRRAPWGART